MNNKLLIAIVLILTVLTVTNPSLKSFVEYNGGYGASEDKNYNGNEMRTANYFLFSTYKCYNYSKPEYYIGVAGNFIEY